MFGHPAGVLAVIIASDRKKRISDSPFIKYSTSEAGQTVMVVLFVKKLLSHSRIFDNGL